MWWASFHMLTPLLFHGLVVASVIVLGRKLWPEQRPSTSSSRALELLDERYAGSEIEREEYLRSRQDIVGR